jgi:hypothetical protein
MRAPTRMDPVTVPETLDLPPARRRWSTVSSPGFGQSKKTRAVIDFCSGFRMCK